MNLDHQNSTVTKAPLYSFLNFQIQLNHICTELHNYKTVSKYVKLQFVVHKNFHVLLMNKLQNMHLCSYRQVSLSAPALCSCMVPVRPEAPEPCEARVSSVASSQRRLQPGWFQRQLHNCMYQPREGSSYSSLLLQLNKTIFLITQRCS